MKNDDRLPGKPDLVLPKYKTVIFVHGCFWHGHNCKAGKLPETRKEFWKYKINQTRERDKRNLKELKELDWNVIVVWQCELTKKKVNCFLKHNFLNEEQAASIHAGIDEFIDRINNLHIDMN